MSGLARIFTHFDKVEICYNNININQTKEDNNLKMYFIIYVNFEKIRYDRNLQKNSFINLKFK